ncbi:hydrolase Nlp/P60 [Variovorax sp. RO1]|uniref:C40 family peptidase n=1 Tax=unclassified Variovorax TaxID=663243 RepID=UPI000C7183B2|nr:MULTISPECIES: C40 family peptidase [unclassified Variovorax]PLC07389.1 hydrolase Nlp/P60 [Variovorax sp. RO1]QOF76260.1 C40 family peptidase [Variovorax sp. 38R]
MRFFVLPASLLFAVAVHAAPQQEKTDDELARMLADKGIIGQLKQVRQTVTERTSDLVVTAIGFLGVPYRRGGNTAESGFDCSGFVRAMYNQTVGHVLPRRAEEQAAATEKIDRSQLKPGDLVFFNTMRRTFSHVGIYVGEGKFIHSPRSGAQVRVEDMNGSYWQRRFDGARRVLSGQGDEVKAAAMANASD